jgi:hypothetical protein
VVAVPCIEWTGHRDSCGYGQTKFQGKSWRAHRVAWVSVHGDIPAGLCVCHHCDNPGCIRVSHLFLGTAAENAADRDAKGRGRILYGESNGRAKLTRAQAAVIRNDPRSCQAIATELGVDRMTISRIKRGRTWSVTD